MQYRQDIATPHERPLRWWG